MREKEKNERRQRVEKCAFNTGARACVWECVCRNRREIRYVSVRVCVIACWCGCTHGECDA